MSSGLGVVLTKGGHNEVSSRQFGFSCLGRSGCHLRIIDPDDRGRIADFIQLLNN
jgi:hypothetical protein